MAKKQLQNSAHGNEKTIRMGTERISSLLIEFAIPAIAATLVNGLYNVISSIFLGQAVGDVGLAVTTAAWPLSMIFVALGMLIGAGGNSLAALKLGQGRRDEAENVLGNTVAIGILMAIIVAVAINITPCREALLALSSTTEDIHDETSIYFWITCMGFIFQMFSYGINNFIRTTGAPNRALFTAVIGAVSCIIFNYLFVMVFGWGVPGSALATICGQFISAATVFWYFVFTPNVSLRIRKKYLRLRLDLVKEILALGMASFLLQVALTIASLALNYQLVIYGNLSALGAVDALATIGITMKIANISVMPISGVAMAAQPLIGYNYGAGNIKRVRKTIGLALAFGIGIGTAIWAATRIWPVELISLFGVEDALLDNTIYALNVQMILLPLFAMQVIVSNYFQATGQPVKAIILSLTRQMIFFLPSLFYLPIVGVMLFGGEGLDYIYIAYPLSDFLSIITSGIFLLFELRRLGRLERGEIVDKFAGQTIEKEEAEHAREQATDETPSELGEPAASEPDEPVAQSEGVDADA